MKNHGSNIRLAIVASAILGLLGGLLGNIVANLIRVPAGWEWLPVAALVLVFLASLPVTLRLTRTSGQRGVTVERVDLKKSKIHDISANGQVTVKDVKAVDSEISDIDAG